MTLTGTISRTRSLNGSVTRSIKVVPKIINGQADVLFYDYDGSIVESYSAEEFLKLQNMPKNPDHTKEELVSQGWNWTLSDAKAYVAKYRMLDIGQMYSTKKTKLFIELGEGRLHPQLGLCVNGTLDVDWGDGTTHSTMTGTDDTSTLIYTDHEYASPGKYTIDIKPSTGTTFGFKGIQQGGNLLSKVGAVANYDNLAYKRCLKAVFIGSGVSKLANHAFSGYTSLLYCVIGHEITTIGNSVFNSCYSLRTIIVPSSITALGTYVFNNCCAMSDVSIPNSVQSIGIESFEYCRSLKRITIPDSMAELSNYLFNACYSLRYAVIPDSIITIGNRTFFDCWTLFEIRIPDSVITIGTYAFYNSIANLIEVGDHVETLNNSAFSTQYGCGVIKFKSETPPTAGSGVFSNLPTDCKILVPKGSLEAYTSVANYPSAETYTYEEY